MAETYHQEMIEHLHAQVRELDERINGVRRLGQYSGDYTDDAKTALVAMAKAPILHEVPCVTCDNYFGNSAPEPEPLAEIT